MGLPKYREVPPRLDASALGAACRGRRAGVISVVLGRLGRAPERLRITRCGAGVLLVDETLVVDLCNGDATIGEALHPKELRLEPGFVVDLSKLEEAFAVCLASRRGLPGTAFVLGVVPEAYTGASDVVAPGPLWTHAQAATADRQFASTSRARDEVVADVHGRPDAATAGDGLRRDVVRADVWAFLDLQPKLEIAFAVPVVGAFDGADRRLLAVRRTHGRTIPACQDENARAHNEDQDEALS